MAFIPICKFQYTRKIHPEARLVFCLRRIDSLFVFFDYYCDCIVLKLAMLEKLKTSSGILRDYSFHYRLYSSSLIFSRIDKTLYPGSTCDHSKTNQYGGAQKEGYKNFTCFIASSCLSNMFIFVFAFFYLGQRPTEREMNLPWRKYVNV